MTNQPNSAQGSDSSENRNQPSSGSGGSESPQQDRPSTFAGPTTHGGGASSAPGEASPVTDNPLEDVEWKDFATRFEVLASLGVGGMGEVVKAMDRKLKRIVAVKRLKGSLVTDVSLRQRFVREALFAARLNHPNLVALYDILQDADGPYLVQEFVDGENLAERLRRGPIAWREAVALLLPVCDGIAHAHEQGIIHRDIKPANILISPKGVTKLGDFGIARSMEATEFTQTGAMLGTLDYMAPEQMDSSRTADARADLYSLAATLYHMVTGEIPRPIMSSELPAELQSVILQAVQRQPQKRQASLVEFERQLRACLVITPSVPSSSPVDDESEDDEFEDDEDDDDDDDDDEFSEDDEFEDEDEDEEDDDDVEFGLNDDDDFEEDEEDEDEDEDEDDE